MRCTKCGMESPQGSRYCMQCGEELIRRDRGQSYNQPYSQRNPQNMAGQQVSPYQQQDMSNQQMQGQPYQYQNMSGQQMQGQPYQYQNMPDQQMQGQPYQYQNVSNQQMQGQPYQNMQGQQMNQQWDAPLPSQPQADLPMNWYKFVIYAQLFLSALFSLGSSIIFFTGLHYNQGISTAKLIYAFHPNLRIVDILYGIIMIGLAIFAIVVRQQLAGFKRNAPGLYLGFIGLNIAMSVLYIIAVAIVLGSYGSGGETFEYLMGSNAGTLGGGAVLLVTNFIYFKKRKHLFIQ